MSEEALRELLQVGQSVWLDNLSRGLMNSGQLQKWIGLGLRGITSNPTIFQKAISGSSDYDDSIRAGLRKGIQDDKELFWGIALEDIARAADLLWPVYEASGGSDGFVSLEVSPDLAYDTEKTIAEAKRLFQTLNKKNVLIKVPATKQGLPAIEKLTGEGVNVNVTLLFSVRRYEEVAEAYRRGLEERIRQGRPVQEIFSVASFFVSRVDTLVDKLLQERLPALSGADRKKAEGFLGQAAVANAKIAYKRYREIFWGKLFQALKGARVQRILWGSTGTKNPAYSDIKYVEELIGPDSINTLPEATIQAFLDHGRVKVTIRDQMEEAEALFPALKNLGIDIGRVTDQLEEEGVKQFADSFTSLLRGMEEKRKKFLK